MGNFIESSATGEFVYIAAHAVLGCAAGAASGEGCGGGAIGGAASAAFSPDFLKAIDPTGASLDPGQQAAMAGFATLLGAGLAGLAGANVLGGATAAQNEVLNNTDQHAADAAKSGGLLGAVGTWLQNTYGDPVGSVQNWGNQFWGQFLGTSSPQVTQNPDDPRSGGGSNNTPSTGAAPVTTEVCIPDEGCIVTPPLVSPGSPNNAPSNATLSNANGGGSSDASSTASTGPQNLGNNVQLYPDGSLRTPDGKFASVSGSPPPGTTAASQFADFLSGNGVNVVGQEVVVNGPLGPRRYDIVTQDANGNLHGIEVKSGGATPNIYQQFTDRFVNQFGAAATGRLAGKSVSSATTVYVP